jgi:hypothetical protein
MKRRGGGGDKEKREIKRNKSWKKEEGKITGK